MKKRNRKKLSLDTRYRYGQIGECSCCHRRLPIKCVSRQECSGCYAKRKNFYKRKHGIEWWSDATHINYADIIQRLEKLGWKKAADILRIRTKQGLYYNWSTIIQVLETELEEEEEQILNNKYKKIAAEPDWDEDNYAYEILTKQSNRENNEVDDN